jgi:uncharacterized membrane protein
MRRYIPNQHGAWAMLIVPYLFGLIASQPRWIHLPLFVAWLLAYLFTFHLLQWIRTGNRNRYLGPIRLYGSGFVVLGGWLAVWYPILVVYGICLLPLFAVNSRFARRNQERMLWNDLAAIIQFSSAVFPAYYAGGGNDWGLAAELFLISLLYFCGTVFYVKTMIREKNNPAYYLGSVGYHVVLLAAASFFRLPLLIILSAVLLARAAGLPKSGITIKQSGMLEIGCSLLVTILVLFERTP